MLFDRAYIGNTRIWVTLSELPADMPHKSRISYAVQLPYVKGSESIIESGRLFVADDLHVLTRDTAELTLATGMSALLSFLSAAGEAYNFGSPDSENRDLFPADVTEWAGQYSEEIDSARFELEEIDA